MTSQPDRRPGPGGSVSERLAAAAAGALVGRAEECARLTAWLAPGGPTTVFVHGPGGIGKTTCSGCPARVARSAY